MGCRPHIVFLEFFKYSVNPPGSSLSIASMPCNKLNKGIVNVSLIFCFFVYVKLIFHSFEVIHVLH